MEHAQYIKACLRLEQLLDQVNNRTPKTDPLMQELLEVSEIIETYENEHFSLTLPTLIEAIKYRMTELKLKQKDLAILLETDDTRVSEYLNGKRNITFEVAKLLYKKLDIDADIILQ